MSHGGIMKGGIYLNKAGRGLSPNVWNGIPIGEWSCGNGGRFTFEDFDNTPIWRDTGASAGVRDFAMGGWYVYQAASGEVAPIPSAAIADKSDLGGIVRITLDTTADFGFMTPNANTSALFRFDDSSGEAMHQAFECRIRVNDVSLAAAASLVFGLIEATAVADTLMTTSVGIPAVDFAGFQMAEDASSMTLQALYSLTTTLTSRTTMNATAHTLAADTWVKLGLRWDGEALYYFVDNVNVLPTTYSSSLHVRTGLGVGVKYSATNFPLDKNLTIVLVAKNLSTDDFTVDIDWVGYGCQLE